VLHACTEIRQQEVDIRSSCAGVAGDARRAQKWVDAMPANQLRVLCVHGIGDHHTDLDWQKDWRNAIESSLTAVAAGIEAKVEFLTYDDLFDRAEITFAGTVEAVAKLLGSGVAGFFRRRRGLFAGVTDRVRWTAGMVVQWVENEDLRAATRTRLVDAIKAFAPRVLCGHSLGSLVCYDTLTSPGGEELCHDRVFVSLGSQIGNPFVVGNFRAGRLTPLASGHWYHLYNKHDSVFTAPIRLSAPNFEQVDTPFDIPGLADHDATEYFRHRVTQDRVWSPVVQSVRTPAPKSLAARFDQVRQIGTRELAEPVRRALLVGINDYPDPPMRLAGCVNDVFLVSSVLQECGFDPEDIRVVLDKRATADGIRKRLEWLLDGAANGDQLVFFYSGHGARLPSYNAAETVDHMDEALVPYDFDWSTERAITDDQIYELYSQLPYECRFVMILDCCHAGGMTRGGSVRVRGIDPPDDVRHRMLRWDAEHEMWVARALHRLNDELADDDAVRAEYVGASGSVCRFGRAVSLRTLPTKQYDLVRERLGHHGPYQPVIMQACHENEFASEYVHGSTSYGAFTYALAKNLRGRRRITFERLVEETATELHDELGYEQRPLIVGPRDLLASQVPWGPHRVRHR
jgi:hypothetical protein